MHFHKRIKSGSFLLLSTTLFEHEASLYHLKANRIAILADTEPTCMPHEDPTPHEVLGEFWWQGLEPCSHHNAFDVAGYEQKHITKGRHRFAFPPFLLQPFKDA